MASRTVSSHSDRRARKNVSCGAIGKIDSELVGCQPHRIILSPEGSVNGEGSATLIYAYLFFRVGLRGIVPPSCEILRKVNKHATFRGNQHAGLRQRTGDR